MGDSNSNKRPILVISEGDVRNLLSVADCIEAVERAMRAVSSGDILVPPRIITPLIDESGFFAVMPGSTSAPPVYGAKVVSLHPTNPSKDLPAIQGFVTLFDHFTGSPVSVIAGAELTAVRTAAASALATRMLAREDARTHGILGTGKLARTHIDAIAAVRELEAILVWGRNAEKAERLAGEAAERTGARVIATADPAEAAACDIVSTVTGASKPILKGEWISKGSHINLVGAHSAQTREADSEAVRISRIYVDSMESALSEAGDLLIPIREGRIAQSDIVGEIGDLLLGRVPARMCRKQVTLYKSLGIVAQDLFVAELVFRTALERGAGHSVPLA